MPGRLLVQLTRGQLDELADLFEVPRPSYDLALMLDDEQVNGVIDTAFAPGEERLLRALFDYPEAEPIADPDDETIDYLRKAEDALVAAGDFLVNNPDYNDISAAAECRHLAVAWRQLWHEARTAAEPIRPF